MYTTTFYNILGGPTINCNKRKLPQIPKSKKNTCTPAMVNSKTQLSYSYNTFVGDHTSFN